MATERELILWDCLIIKRELSDSTVFYQSSMGEEDNLSDKIRNNIRRIVMFKLVTMALLLILAYGIGLVMLELKNAPLMDDEILSSPNNEGDK